MNHQVAAVAAPLYLRDSFAKANIDLDFSVKSVSLLDQILDDSVGASALFGLVQGGIIPCYAMIIREYFPPQEAGTRLGVVLMATIFGMVACQ